MHKCICEERCNQQFGFQTRYVMFESSVAKQKTYIERHFSICESNDSFCLFFELHVIKIIVTNIISRICETNDYWYFLGLTYTLNVLHFAVCRFQSFSLHN